jgi:DNA-binding XRE family transcriptional regulator
MLAMSRILETTGVEMAKSFDALVKTDHQQGDARAGRDADKELLAELPMAELRQLAGMSQRELAKVLGIKQPSLSKLENQTDIQVSTLQRIVEELGGKLEVVARFPKGNVKIAPFGTTDGSRSRPAGATSKSKLF